MTSIEISSLSKSFGKKLILDSINLTLNSGTVYGLVGLNGAGKTTLLKICLGLIKQDQGQVNIIGHEPWRHEHSFYQNLGVVLDHDGFSGNLTVKENLEFFARAKGITWDEVLKFVNRFWKRPDFFQTTKQVKTLSRGLKMQCALCRAFMGNPQICILDEPLTALDIEAYDIFGALIQDAQDRGATVIMSSHQLDAIERWCNEIGILHERKLQNVNLSSSNESAWILITQNSSEKWGECIQQQGGTEISLKNSTWEFTISNSKDSIPKLVSRLVQEGCLVEQIYCKREGIESIIRTKFSEKT